MAQELGFEELDASDIQNLLHTDKKTFNYEDFKELTGLQVSSLDNEENIPHPLLQPILSLTKILSKFSSEITRALERLSEDYLNFERSMIFKRSKIVTLNCYREKLEFVLVSKSVKHLC
ncbi:Hypothetical predicted protein [Octopus vulgaris]|uniref:Uncharacterized protein n=1 Tax=Octopus vulgaris TaxID=6645 RepID=A0AA36B1S9_OCTVU|nr:Hypothetical predicted protein [Octopus vulgaris]